MLKILRAFAIDYLSRHRDKANKMLHIIGIPVALAGLFYISTARPKTGLIYLFIGYLLQWIGHTYFEKNEVGEWILIKKIIRRLGRR